MLRYLKGTIDIGLAYEKGVKDLNVIGYSDSDFVDDVEDKRAFRDMYSFLVVYQSLRTA